MDNQQNSIPVEEKRICKKCLNKLPNKSDYCMYCGTDNAATSVQVEYKIQNNEQLKKYKLIEAKKKKPLWYFIFILLLIDVVVVNTVMIFNQDKMFVEVNSARFENYEKSYYLDDGAYIAYKNNKAKIIGKNRQDYLEITSEIQKYNIKDIQEVNNNISKRIYVLTDGNIILEIVGSRFNTIELENEYNDVYEYLNEKNNNCLSEKEYSVLTNNSYYFDTDSKEVIFVSDPKYNYVNDRVCYSYTKSIVLTSEELELNNPELIYSSNNGETIILKDNKEVLKIESGIIKERIKEYKIDNKTVSVEKIKKIIYKSKSLLSDNENIIIIDNKDNIHELNGSNKIVTSNASLAISVIKLLLNNLDDDGKINLAILLILLISNFIFYYKMADTHTFSKVFSMSGMLMIELVLFTLIRGGGYKLGSGEEFFALLEGLFSTYLGIFIVSTIITQIGELTIKLLDLIKFRNIFSFILTFIAIISIFFNILASGSNGLFFAIFALGSFWAYLTETEDIDIDLFIRENTKKPIIILSVIVLILFLVMLKIFHIGNYFILLFLLSVLFALYLTVRPELAKKELTGKSIKSLLVMIMYLTVSFINTLLAMNLFTKLQSDYEGKILESVLLIAFTYILYFAVTFMLLTVISSVFRIVHKIIKTANKKTNSVVQFLIFAIIAIIAFTAAIYFFPEIVNLINTAVNKIFSSVTK